MTLQTQEQMQNNVTLQRLLPNWELPLSCAHQPINNIQLDSRKVQLGDAFIALSAWDEHSIAGHDFIEPAIAAGASVIIYDAPEFSVSCAAVTRIGVPQLAEQVSAMAAEFYRGQPFNGPIIAITGTNGKTTCSQLLAQLLALLNKNVGVVGTLGSGLWAANSAQAQLQKTGFTTPDAISTQRLLSELADSSADVLSMEVSSHALEQGRVAALKFDTAIFTNLSHDHLDYHGDMQSYAAAKARLFQYPGLKHSVINIDDAFGLELSQRLRADGSSVIEYSISNSQAQIFTTHEQFNATGFNATVHTPWGAGELRSPLLGRFNLSNILAVVASACLQGFALADVLALLPKLGSVSGRMHAVTISEAQDIAVVVDFAHTPDALENALQALQPQPDHQLYCVFGCGGDRDVAKRSPMGSIASRLSNVAVLTSDNPRSENPNSIIADIEQGLSGSAVTHIQADRAAAIEWAIAEANAGDTILIAGKGHEAEQIFATHTEAFSDVEHAEQALRLRAQNLSGGAQ